jgi:outer membrane receptor protein involved in Fe transport
MSKRGQVLSVICGIALLALVTPPATLAGSFDGSYTGKRVLTKGGNPPCPAEEAVSVTIRGSTLTFTDSALKNFGVGFDPQPDGSFGEIDTEMGGAVVVIRGRIVGNTLDADVTNGPCQHHWHLKAVAQ